jgi:hypothetical protein
MEIQNFKMWPIVFIGLWGLSACVATTPMKVSKSTVTPSIVKPLTVALIIPDTTRSFNVALNQETECFGTGNVNASFGDIFSKSVTGRLTRSFQKVTTVSSAAQAGNADVIVEASLSELSFMTGCWADANARFTVVGALRTLNPDGIEIWRSARTKSQTAFGGLADMRTVSADLANQMGLLADEWLSDLLNVPSATYAFNVDAPSGSAKASGDKDLAKFPNNSIDVKYTPGIERPDDFAVIISNANYSNRGRDIPNVVPAYADAEGIKRYFTEALGIREGNIIYLKDATGSQIAGVFGNKENHKGQLFNWTKPNISNVYVYYAGHGAPAGSDGTAYLVPTDATSQTIELSGYPLSTLYNNLAKVPAKSITVILEACFSGVSQGGSLVPRSSGLNVVPKTPIAPTNVRVISAGAADQMASWEQDSSHSLFTKYFLKAMSGEGDEKPYGNGDGKVSDDELSKYLDQTMTYYARRYYGRDQKAQIAVGGG